MAKLDVSKKTITKITMLLSAYTLFHSIDALKNETDQKHDYKGKLKEKANEFLIFISQEFNAEFKQLWKSDADSLLSEDLASTIAEIGKLIATADSPVPLWAIKQLLKSEIDFDKIKIVELKHKPKIKKS